MLQTNWAQLVFSVYFWTIYSGNNMLIIFKTTAYIFLGESVVKPTAITYVHFYKVFPFVIANSSCFAISWFIAAHLKLSNIWCGQSAATWIIFEDGVVFSWRGHKTLCRLNLFDHGISSPLDFTLFSPTSLIFSPSPPFSSLNQTCWVRKWLYCNYIELLLGYGNGLFFSLKTVEQAQKIM